MRHVLMKDGELTVADAAAILGRHHLTVQRWCREGRIPHRRQGRTFFLKEAAVLAIRDRERRVERLKAEAQKARAA